MPFGIVRVPLAVCAAAGQVPAVLWLPDSARPAGAVVLLGHGGSQHKESPGVLARAGRLVGGHGLACVAIDGPYHGDRAVGGLSGTGYQSQMVTDGVDAVLDRMTDDWLEVLDAVSVRGDVDTARPAYLGMSMGARFGLRLGARMGSRLGCLVLGKFGVVQRSLHPGLNATATTEADARRITAPLLFHVQSADEIFPREGSIALFDLFGSADKTLVTYPGRHADTTHEALDTWCDFIAEHV